MILKLSPVGKGDMKQKESRIAHFPLRFLALFCYITSVKLELIDVILS